MPRITSIKPQKNQKRVNIYLDGKFGFGLDLENFLKLGLKVGEELSEDEIEKIIKKAEFQKTLDKLLKFASLRPRSQKEIRDWFRRKKVYPGLRKELTTKLKKLDLVDDEKFAAWWVGQRTTFKPRGYLALIYELRLKGIDKKVVEKVLEEINLDEEKVALNLLKNKMYKWEKLSGREAREKMASFLSRKGFSWEIIEKVLRKL